MIDQFLRYLQFEKRYSDHTLKAYEDDLKQLYYHLRFTFELDDPAQIRHTHLRSWVVTLSDEGLTPRSINRKIACLKSYFKFLQGRQILDKNPATRLKPLKTESKLPSFVKENEMMRLLDDISFPEDFDGVRDKVLIEIFYSTGIRLSELINLKASDLNFYNSSIKVLGKRNKERIIPISNSLIKVIKNYQAVKKDMALSVDSERLLLCTDKGLPLYPMLVYRIIKKYLGQVTTLSKKSPHVLRHTFATHLLDRGADLNALKDLLGHTSLAATQVYTHNSLEKLKSTFDQAHPKA